MCVMVFVVFCFLASCFCSAESRDAVCFVERSTATKGAIIRSPVFVPPPSAAPTGQGDGAGRRRRRRRNGSVDKAGEGVPEGARLFRVSYETSRGRTWLHSSLLWGV